MKEKLLTVAFVCFILNIGKAQTELKQIVPLSPNAATMAKYGEIPVGHFTGVPNINIPLYTIKSGTLELPLSLNYHAGGNKVEAIASWVGLGWSLGALPSISRSVRGLPDEGGGGYFSTYGGKTVKQIFDENDSGNSSTYDNFMVSVNDGFSDAQADIYSYNIVGESGKFYYNQDLDEFITIPKSNVRVERDGSNFTITSSRGIVYVFNIKEKNATTTSTTGSAIITSWFASTMTDPNTTNQISFDYRNDENTFFKTKTAVSRYIKLTGATNPLNPLSSINSYHQVEARPLERISFKNGYIEFNPDMEDTERQDLQGGHFLKDLQVFDNDDNLITHYHFTYNYLDGGGCTGEASEAGKWLILKKMEQVLPLSPKDNLIHEFKYDQNNIPPCRVSAGQDYWGYYNGRNSSQNLIPTIVIPPNYFGKNNPMLRVSGADRGVAPSASKFGILKEIIYPTKGRSEFIYENNRTNDQAELPPTFSPITPYLLGGDSGPDGEPPSDVVGNGTSSDPYRKSFSIDVGPNLYLNGNEPDGGVYINVVIVTPPGCDLSDGQSDPCAYFTIKDSNSGQYMAFPTIDASFYLPDGDYEMSASFSPTLNDYGEFIYQIGWDELDDVSSEINYIGGLRIKEMKHYPDETSDPIVKRYRYVDGLNSNEPSGDVFYDFSHYYLDILTVYGMNDGVSDPIADYFRIRSYSNTQQVTHSGSLVGYKTVIEETTDSEGSGITIYEYSHERDDVSAITPFPPGASRESQRGQLLQTSHFKKVDNEFFPVKRVINLYNNRTCSEAEYSYNLKTGDHHILKDSYATLPDRNTTLYLTGSSWSELKSTKEVIYGTDTTEKLIKVTQYTYSPTHLQVESIQTTDSKQIEKEERFYYTQDLELTDTEAEASRQKLETLNKLSTVLRREKYYDEQLIESVTTNYGRFNAAEQVFPSEVLVNLRGTGVSEESRTQFLSYDLEGNLQTQQLTDNIKASYLWGYDNSYPIAKVNHAGKSEIAFTSFESEEKGNWTYSGSSIGNSAAPTGDNVYDLNTGVISKINNSVGSYVVAYWTSSNEPLSVNGSTASTGSVINGWHYYEHEVILATPGTITISGDELIDEVRLYPKGAQMTTYTYDPLVGISSQTDPNGLTTYYEYDELKRLKLIKDIDGNVISKHTYNYKR